MDDPVNALTWRIMVPSAASEYGTFTITEPNPASGNWYHNCESWAWPSAAGIPNTTLDIPGLLTQSCNEAGRTLTINGSLMPKDQAILITMYGNLRSSDAPGPFENSFSATLPNGETVSRRSSLEHMDAGGDGDGIPRSPASPSLAFQKVDENGLQISGADITGESCTKFDNEPDWTCISLDDYDTTWVNEDSGFFQATIDQEPALGLPEHKVTIWEREAPDGYVLDSTPKVLVKTCGGWHYWPASQVESTGGLVMPEGMEAATPAQWCTYLVANLDTYVPVSGMVTFVNQPVVTPEPSPSSTPDPSPSPTSSPTPDPSPSPTAEPTSTATPSPTSVPTDPTPTQTTGAVEPTATTTPAAKSPVNALPSTGVRDGATSGLLLSASAGAILLMVAAFTLRRRSS